MEVILREEVKSLGRIGDIVKVKPGYARNYLIPRGLALVADTKNVRALEHEQNALKLKAKKVYDAAKTLAEKLSNLKVTLKAKSGEEDKLFGSVTASDIAEAVKAEGFEIDKKKIALDEPIKRLGDYQVEIKLGSDVKASIGVTVIAE